jgi:hypothetical protein
LSKRGRVTVPTQLAIYAVVEAQIQRLAFHTKVSASQTSCRTARATEADRLAALQRRGPDNAPTANHLVLNSRGVVSEALAFAEGQFVAAAEVDDVPDVKRSQTVIEMDTEARYTRCPVSCYAPAIEQITRVRDRLRVGIGKEKVQTAGELLLDLCL